MRGLYPFEMNPNLSPSVGANVIRAPTLIEEEIK
jgi:hypothetical protein